MAMTDTGRLAQFERRYAAAPASPLAFLQLAEEYRRAGRFADAIRVLEPGLKEHPTYLSAQVALGRTRLEMGEGAAAAEILSEVLSKDPTHLLAYKLLAEARLRCGDPVAARQTLDRYRLLNDGDPEIADFDRRIDELGADRPAPVAVTDPPPGNGGAPVAAPPSPPPPPVIGPVFPRVGTGEPFATLGSFGDHDRYLAGLAAEGIFVLPAALTPLPPIPPVPPVAPTAPVEEAIGAAVPVAEVEAAPPGEVAATVPTPATVLTPATPTPVPAVADGSSTVTLGQLYLEQLHLAEAEQTFRSVLERDPGNAAALLGLAEVERSRPRPLGAHDLLRWWLGGDGADASGGRRPRRTSLLEAYLARIRGRSRTDVS